MSLGVALGWHVHPFEDLLALVRRAESLGYRAVYVDGDVSMVPSRGEADVLDGWTVQVALLVRTSRIEIGSLRIAHQWNAARLAQAVASAERIVPGRLRFLVSIGGQPSDRRFGFPALGPGQRIRCLDETLDAVRALWRGETVSRKGRYVQLEGARVRPCPPPGRPPVEVAGRRPHLLRVVARHADRWDMNLPPVERWVARAQEDLRRACEREGRDPDSIERQMWIFTRLGDPGDPGLAEEFLRLNPWFGDLRREELAEAMVVGGAAECRARLETLRQKLGLALPVIDLSGLPRAASEALLDACAPSETRVDPAT